jgi:fibro-slime domain-containing protein
MKLRSAPLALFAFASVVGLATAASAADTLSVQYFEVAAGSGGDFGICCSSPPATLPVITLGSALGPDGRPVTTLGAASGGVVDQNAAGEIMWWTNGVDGIVSTGSGTITLPSSGNMFAPNSTGTNNNDFFETAVLTGSFTATGGPASFTVSSDDDAFVYVDGHFVGGNPGVHGTETAILDLGSLSAGSHSLEVFYADRAHTDANLSLSVTGGTLTGGVPEPASWALMLVGFGGLGAVLRNQRKRLVATA